VGTIHLHYHGLVSIEMLKEEMIREIIESLSYFTSFLYQSLRLIGGICWDSTWGKKLWEHYTHVFLDKLFSTVICWIVFLSFFCLQIIIEWWYMWQYICTKFWHKQSGPHISGWIDIQILIRDFDIFIRLVKTYRYF